MTVYIVTKSYDYEGEEILKCFRDYKNAKEFCIAICEQHRIDSGITNSRFRSDQELKSDSGMVFYCESYTCSFCVYKEHLND